MRFPKSQAPLTRRAISTAAPVSPSFHPPPAALGEPAQGPSPPTSRQGYRAFINTFAKWDIFISSFFSFCVICKTIKTFGETRWCRRFVLILFADVADTDGFIGRLNFSHENDHIKPYCAKATSKKNKLSRVGGRGRFRGREGLSWAAVQPYAKSPPAPERLFFSAQSFFL